MARKGCSSSSSSSSSNGIKETEVEMRKIAIARRFPDDYVEHRKLADPVRCSFITEQFEETARKCAGLYGKNAECDRKRKLFLLCEAVKEEVEDLKRPIVAAEAQLEKYKKAGCNCSRRRSRSRSRS